jgi:hypothetical protein
VVAKLARSAIPVGAANRDARRRHVVTDGRITLDLGVTHLLSRAIVRVDTASSRRRRGEDAASEVVSKATLRRADRSAGAPEDAVVQRVPGGVVLEHDAKRLVRELEAFIVCGALKRAEPVRRTIAAWQAVGEKTREPRPAL